MEHSAQTILFYWMIFNYQVVTCLGETQDQSSPRANTLFDDADDIQKQLENEARDRMKFERPKTIWVFHLPAQTFSYLNPTESIHSSEYNHLRKRYFRKHKRPAPTTERAPKEWQYKAFSIPATMNAVPKAFATSDQKNWAKTYPECGGHSQSPINLPNKGLIKSKARKLLFINYDAVPTLLKLQNDGRRVTLMGEWDKEQRPLVYGGAAYSRRYLFHSLAVHWPSEHSVGGLQYPIESQVLHISAEYKDFNDAVEASSSDPLAFLGIVNIYRFGNQTHQGIGELLKTSVKMRIENITLAAKPLSYYSPPFEKYVCYQGSLTYPPCTESVLWFVRGKALSVNRDEFNVPYGMYNTLGEPDVKPFRLINPLNDRLVYFFG